MDNEHKGKCSGWAAVHDFMPPKPARLRVTGKCVFPKPGFRVTLKHHVPQGINPAILLLDRVVTLPVDPLPGGETAVSVFYEEQTSHHYKEVEIIPDNVTLKVEEVS
jgi:hypothetical protein